MRIRKLTVVTSALVALASSLTGGVATAESAPRCPEGMRSYHSPQGYWLEKKEGVGATFGLHMCRGNVGAGPNGTTEYVAVATVDAATGLMKVVLQNYNPDRDTDRLTASPWHQVEGGSVITSPHVFVLPDWRVRPVVYVGKYRSDKNEVEAVSSQSGADFSSIE